MKRLREWFPIDRAAGGMLLGACVTTVLLTESGMLMPAYMPRYHCYLMQFFPLLSVFAPPFQPLQSRVL